jgi:arabinofuranan 3-O-arabinosyltransferase
VAATVDTTPTAHARGPARLTVAAMALLAYVPLLLTERGQVAADTKAYLYLDPTRLLERAGWMWNTHVDAGTVTHQNIGYLFPLGPYYWLMHAVGMPMWVAERLWMGTILFAAGAGTMWMLRRLGVRGVAVAVGGFVYMLSPYLLAYMGRTSVILLPWAALPWLVGLVRQALLERTWRAPALIAVVVTLMASTNASSVIFVLLGPALLVPFMIWGTREVTFRQSLAALGRTAVTTAPAQLWWVAGLYVQGAYGLPILQLTETLQTVAQTSTSPELLRGLGYWYFYGRDGLSQWTASSMLYTQNPAMLALGFVLPLLSLVSAFLTRWRYRAYFVTLVIVGMVLGIGTYPYDDPSPFGSLIKATSSSSAGFALRNSPRAVPLLVLGLAALLAIGTQAVTTRLAASPRRPAFGRAGLAIGGALIALAILGLPPVWRGGLVSQDLEYPEKLPDYWQQAAAHLDAAGTDTRVLELPGSDFAAYRWGETQDPLTPGIIDRPWVGRELTAYGTPPSTDLIRALDRRLQEGVADPASVAPIARLLSASDVLLRMDSQYERYRSPRPADLWSLFGSGQAVDGLGTPTTFGVPYKAVADPRQPTVDEQELGRTISAELPPPLAVFPVSDVRPVVRAESTSGSLVVWGDGEGLVDAAESGLLTGDQATFYAATLLADPAAQSTVTGGAPSLVVTDTNRRRAQRWGTIRENYGATEAPGSVPLVKDPKDTRLDVFPDGTDDQRAVADYGPDVRDVRATSYGNIVAYSAEARPVNAIDGDLRTAWSTGGYSEVVGDRLRIDLAHPVTADHVDLTQLQGNRYITGVTVTLDDAEHTTVALDDASFTDAGQRIDLGGAHTFSSLELRIDAANISGIQSFLGLSNVGIKELRIPGVQAAEWVRVPSAGLDQMATGSTPLTYLFSRLRADAVEGFRQDPELQLRRIFTVPDARSFSFTGEARLGGRTDGAVIDELLGRPGLAAGFPVVAGADYLSGVPADRPSALLDGDPGTAWTTGFGPQEGRYVTITTPAPVTVDHLDLTVVADGRHSVPTSLVLTAADGTTRTVAVPPIADGATDGAVTSVTVPVEPFTASSIKVAVGSVREVTTKEYFSGGDHAMPVAIAELGLPVTVGPLPVSVPETCRTGLVQLDGTDVPVRLSGTVADAQARRPLALQPCTSSDVALGAGEHRLSSSPGLDTGVDVDRIELGSVGAASAAVSGAGTGAAGGGATPVATGTAGAPTPTLEVDQTGQLTYKVTVDGATEPFWLVLGQSLSRGWTAKVEGGPSLGEPMLIDGFANGWHVDPATTGGSFVVTITWAPQRVVWAAVGVSALWFLGVCVLLAGTTIRRRRRRLADHDARDDAQDAVDLASTGPSLTVPWHRHPLASTAARLAVAAGMGLVGLVVGGPVVGLAVAVLTGVAAWLPRGRALLAAVPVVLIGGTALLYVALQVRRRYLPGVEWPGGFSVTHQLVLIAVLSVVSEVVVRFAARRWPQAATSASDASQMNDGSALTR